MNHQKNVELNQHLIDAPTYRFWLGDRRYTDDTHLITGEWLN